MPPTSLSRGRRSRALTPLTPDTRPRLATGVAFEPTADDAVWIAVLHGVPSSRVSRAVVALLRAMDGETALRELHGRFAASEPWESFLPLIERFRASGLFEGQTTRPPGRLSYRPPFTVQIATLRAPALFRRLDRLIVSLSRRTVMVALVVVLVLGALAALLQRHELHDVLIAPMSLSGLVVLVVVLSLITLLHEGAHGLTLTRFGGRPRRAGVMLFYLTPAFFVDVTDGWRLPDRRHRVAVALAGPAVHAVVAALALLAALVLRHPPLRETLLLLALSCAAIVVLNLIPFVRFDGYIALMSALDEPNLRGRTIRDGADFVTRLLFGGPPTRPALTTWWSVPFGLASLLTPVVLVLFAVARIARALAGGGPVLGLLVVALEAAVALVGVALVAGALHRVLRSGVSRVRFVSVGIALVAGVVLAGSVIPMPVAATYGFVVDGDRVLLVRGGGEVDRTVPEGAPVVLLSNGILANGQVGEGTVQPQRAEPTTVPVDALFPVKADGVTISATIVARVDLLGPSAELPPTGQARVEFGTRNLWQTLWTTGVVLPLSGRQDEK
ncbi:hypothetical protein HWD99_11780 [Microbacterium sp. C5A9]|uniref:daptide biosynthesis intramembrane metalloprotease n=1 Tax=Microbacterium sp. C5A9 TaxID=2736663 RepID=UPI001F522026|nr:daptide biosynthesis intramembrane metalloprotease [Microbacterium sp. C5A9]MCI1019308.1 hypothetical protein [Microbacterium sp. C5A9]